MKHKLLSLLIALLAATSLWAIGRNDGSNMANAIDFDWINGAMHYESEGIRWYRLDLAPLYYGADSLRFYITNPSNTEAVNVVCKTSILLQDVGVTLMDSIIQTLAPQTTYDGWMLRRELFVTEQIIEIFFTVSTTGAVKLFWQAFYPSGDSCEESKHGGGFQEAGTKWYDIKAPDRDENEVMEYNLSISFFNIDEDYHDNDISNTISLNFKTDCNSPAFYDTTFTIDPASGESVLLYDDQLAALGWPDLLFSCTSSTSCRIEHTYYSYVPGESCFESINLNWEPVEQSADLNRWYALHTHDGDFNPIIPDTCDLRIKINNLSDETANVNADVYFECREEERISQKSYVLEPYGSEYLDINRDFLERFVWPPILLDISSNQNISIQAELIPNMPRDTMRDTIVAYVCQGIWFVDTITGIGYDIESSMTWTDTIDFQDGLQIKDSIITFYIHPLVMPEPLSAEEMRGIGAVPLLFQGMPLQVAESNAALTEYYRNLGNSVDLIVRIDTAYWAKPVYKANGDLDSKKEAPLDLSTQYSANDYSDTLLLVVRSEECSFIMRIEYIFPIEGIHYSTIADLYNMAQDSAFTLGAFDVVYVPAFQNGANMYIKDETGSMVIYKPNYGLQAGDHVEAGLQGTLNIYHGIHEIAPISTKAELTVTAGEAPAPMEATEVPSLTNVSQFVVYKNMSFTTDTAFVSNRRHAVQGIWNGQEIAFYNQYYIGATLSANKTYNITAVNSVYGTTPQAYPLIVEEINTESNCDIIYLDQAGLQIETEPIILHLPVAPVIEGFTFLNWQVVAGDLEQGIYIQAVYTANDPTNAPAVYTNPANKAQKLIRNGQVYILTDDKIYSVTGQRVK